ncbi:MAG: hypothetical protein O7C75_14925 [Verrucomicrobia bacterium]|nr:hypothetical protein [Verrucomicrobiota bacterium]
MNQLYHVREERLPSGTLIQSGRWGETVLKQGGDHPFFFREHLLEVWRREKTTVAVSRFACTFAFEGRDQAINFAEQNEFVLPVVPVDPNAPKAKLDMLWLTWMGDAGATTDKIMEWCASYWAGQLAADIKPGASPSWEWLFACSLRVK